MPLNSSHFSKALPVTSFVLRPQAEVHAAVHGAVQALLQDEYKADAARKAALVESDYQAAGAGAAGEQEGEVAAAA